MVVLYSMVELLMLPMLMKSIQAEVDWKGCDEMEDCDRVDLTETDMDDSDENAVEMGFVW